MQEGDERKKSWPKWNGHSIFFGGGEGAILGQQMDDNTYLDSSNKLLEYYYFL